MNFLNTLLFAVVAALFVSANAGGFDCNPDEFQCSDGTCISNTFVCDLSDDCPDGSDETLDACLSIPCVFNRCPSTGYCIGPDDNCDGTLQCPDGLDELNCFSSSSSIAP